MSQLLPNNYGLSAYTLPREPIIMLGHIWHPITLDWCVVQTFKILACLWSSNTTVTNGSAPDMFLYPWIRSVTTH